MGPLGGSGDSWLVTQFPRKCVIATEKQMQKNRIRPLCNTIIYYGGKDTFGHYSGINHPKYIISYQCCGLRFGELGMVSGGS